MTQEDTPTSTTLNALYRQECANLMGDVPAQPVLYNAEDICKKIKAVFGI